MWAIIATHVGGGVDDPPSPPQNQVLTGGAQCTLVHSGINLRGVHDLGLSALN
jgi:hypothetical protein